jgi:hypothetical protein
MKLNQIKCIHPHPLSGPIYALLHHSSCIGATIAYTIHRIINFHSNLEFVTIMVTQ